ncbi:hypothetical protein IM697_01625 [Streptomyces ferrugineus]|uniref:Uncharacterized protein n=1 Tax=Streptomyces ferrugineus TaxID=1413221 RepID=A0A7M2SP04_9ACTN|nr:hypothetical protein [Streptomyces ferrugineus]QOV37193.1 hypothetical protein IM697_01625 [Streptomyces ferrugineus]
MLNRIRRAVFLTRARYFRKGRHRRPLTPARLSTSSASPTSADASTVVVKRASIGPDHRHSLRGEDTALVRPYVLAWERRVRARPVVIAPHLPADAWSTLAGVN